MSPVNQELRSHPLADIFPLIEGAEFEELVEDIKANGLREPIAMFEDKVLDGRNRYRACAAAGTEPTFTVYQGDNPAAYVISANIRRRHLTVEQKRDLIAKLVKAQPEKSNRQIAKAAKVDDKTVAKARRKLEATADIPQLKKTVGADGKARKQPAKKKRSADAEQEEADKQECIALWQKVQQAEKEAAGESAKKKRAKKKKTKLYEIIDATGKRRRVSLKEFEAHMAARAKERETKIARVIAILVDRIGLEGLTLIWAADTAIGIEGHGFLDLLDTINVPGTYGAEAYAKSRDGEYGFEEFFAKYAGGEPAPTNADDPSASAEAMKAQFAATADPWDAVGDFPDACRRAPKAVAS